MESVLVSTRIKSNLSFFFSSVCLSRYENPLSPLGQHISSELGLTKRHFFEIPTPHCNLDLDEYEYADDFDPGSCSVFSQACWAPWALELKQLVIRSHQSHGVAGSGLISCLCVNRMNTKPEDTVGALAGSYMCWTNGHDIWSDQKVDFHDTVPHILIFSLPSSKNKKKQPAHFRPLLPPHMLTQETCSAWNVCINNVWSEYRSS